MIQMGTHNVVDVVVAVLSCHRGLHKLCEVRGQVTLRMSQDVCPYTNANIHMPFGARRAECAARWRCIEGFPTVTWAIRGGAYAHIHLTQHAWMNMADRVARVFSLLFI